MRGREAARHHAVQLGGRHRREERPHEQRRLGHSEEDVGGRADRLGARAAEEAAQRSTDVEEADLQQPEGAPEPARRPA